ncbi:MAG: nicotinate phosphoribosyltransferase [Candidatus Omnitrophota bacterium]
MNKALLIDLYELTMAQVYFKYKPSAAATFDLFIRSPRRPFYVACGIGEAITSIETFRFTKEDIDYLRELTLFEDEFLEYLKDFSFQGTVWAVEEPEIVFSGEPIMRISGNLIEAQLLESMLLNKINFATTLATKAARVVLAAGGRSVYDFSLRRTQGQEASLAAAKYSYIAGAQGTSNVLAGFLYKIPVVGTMAHSFVMSFEREIESFMKFVQTFPTKSVLLVDTYDTKKGVQSAIRAAKFLKKEGVELLGVRLDSGDLAEDAKYARNILDQEGLIDTDILVSGNLDEYKISALIESKAPIDSFGVGTNMGCSADLPYTDVIYKLAEIQEKGKDFIPVMKLSESKCTLPSCKQVFRVYGADNIMKKDIIGLDAEPLTGKRLLKKVMECGTRLHKAKDIQEQRKICAQKLYQLPESLRHDGVESHYPVGLSERLSALTVKLTQQIAQRISRKVVFMDIDTQYDFVHKTGSLSVSGAGAIVTNLKKLTNFAKQHNILIISSQDTHTKNDPEFKDFAVHCVAGTRGHKKIKETTLKLSKIMPLKKTYSVQELADIASRYFQVIFEKSTLSIFSNPNILGLLESIFPDKIYVYGVVTEHSIKDTIEGLMKEGFSVAIVEDAVKEISSREKEKLFSLWKKKGIEFITAQEVFKRCVSAA